MLRGAIELVNDERIDGWLYSDFGEVFDRTVLAFVDDQCVGSGRIGIVRDDLKAAGLADGRLGFSFPIAVADPSDLPRVIVKLESSDFSLLQSSATKGRSDLFQAPAAALARLEWMRVRGMLSPAEAAFLKYVQQLGAFDHSLVQPKSNGAEVLVEDPLKSAQHFLELLLLREAELVETDLSAACFDEIGMAVLADGGEPLSIVALWSAAPVSIAIVEGSQNDRRRSGGFEGAIEYRLGPDRLLFVDLGVNARIEVNKPMPLKIFSAY
ncbi:hypothetical protein M2323_001276 [Rhodoblastus acidophilus]|uniref:hypothetical protein n=1 Tax=Rhodoblastus acidophilus TaxID=1074 RepID=UPI0022255619|nr:hypothetical protein [Rhodoblastus acidophilus]MCW2283504.1 hypothetical protein [Rhodoblastus acidophilus]MCW2332364.1 hypothetical protein [Rhodoblastus acidophilus]